MKQGKYREALAAFKCLRSGPAGPLIAARDMYYAHAQLEEESRLISRRGNSGQRADQGIELRGRLGESSATCRGPATDLENQSAQTIGVFQYQTRQTGYWQRFGQLFSVPRCRRASLCAATAMLTQQLTGVNTIGGSAPIINFFFVAPALLMPPKQAFLSTTLLTNTDAAPIVASWIGFAFGAVNYLYVSSSSHVPGK